jgi:pimeloyl-ACP methyl ester carboxylesterase
MLARDHVSDKPSIILLPGLDGTGRLFGPLIRELEAEAQVRVISYPAERFLGYSDLADFVVGHLPPGPYAIVAESFSGPVAVLVGARGPAGLRGILLSASFVAPPAPAWLRVVPFEWLFRVGIPRTVLRYFLLDAGSAGMVAPEVVAAITLVAAPVLGARIREVLSSDTSDALRSCAVPVVFLTAAEDRLVGPRTLRAARRARPGIEVVTIEGPHLLLQARPVESATVILGLVKRWFAVGELRR